MRNFPALALSLLALILALGGTALAGGSSAGHITRPQVKRLVRHMAPSLSVRHAKSAIGATRAATATSALHATSADSATTAATAARVGTLPSGASESGFYAAGGAGPVLYAAVTYPQALAATIPDGHIVWSSVGAIGSSAHCPAYGRAERGFLCLYDSAESGVSNFIGYSEEFSAPSAGAIGRWNSNGTAWVAGEWTVTAP